MEAGSSPHKGCVSPHIACADHKEAVTVHVQAEIARMETATSHTDDARVNVVPDQPTLWL